MKLKIKKLIPDLALRYHSDGASGIDIVAPYDCYLHSGVTHMLNAGFCVEFDEGYEGQIRPRSSLSSAGVEVALGTIDSDYRGEIRLCVTFNSNRLGAIVHPNLRKLNGFSVTEIAGENEFSPGPVGWTNKWGKFLLPEDVSRLRDVFKVCKGDRIAQLVIAPVQRCEIEYVDELTPTARGEGGFGSTGR